MALFPRAKKRDFHKAVLGEILVAHRRCRPAGNETVPHLGAGEPSGPGRTSLFLSDGWEPEELHDNVLFC
jgi:hypothetical protein